MLAKQVNANGYRQNVGSTDELKMLQSNLFDNFFCQNILESADDREIIVGEFYRMLKKNSNLSIVKHNRNGRVMQVVVVLNNFYEANNLLDGQNSNTRQFSLINFYDDSDITNWCANFLLLESFGLRTFWDLQQNQEYKKIQNGQNG